ncbi:MAG: hypothetical protein CMO74_05385 [Verrucomicrobiales bacterium]|nr:hypothetical protein [Verrucomicrobiales bacterium]|tara:strand:- start:225 stop:458 length:234 start_codon:yes stop_codon:yes gene_type:complete
MIPLASITTQLHTRRLVNPKLRNLRIDELQRLERELREEFKKSKQAGIKQEIRDVEAVIRDKIWNTGGAQRKKERVK